VEGGVGGGYYLEGGGYYLTVVKILQANYAMTRVVHHLEIELKMNWQGSKKVKYFKSCS